jgi:hypothetical protein
MTTPDVPAEAIRAATEAVVRAHFEMLHAAGVSVAFEQISERTRSVVRRQVAGSVEAALAAALPVLRAQWEAEHGALLNAYRAADSTARDVIGNLRAELAEARRQVEDLRLIANVNGDSTLRIVQLERELGEARRQVEAVRELHHPCDHGGNAGPHCAECDTEEATFTPYPCPTVALLSPVVAPTQQEGGTTCTRACSEHHTVERGCLLWRDETSEHVSAEDESSGTGETCGHAYARDNRGITIHRSTCRHAKAGQPWPYADGFTAAQIRADITEYPWLRACAACGPDFCPYCDGSLPRRVRWPKSPLPAGDQAPTEPLGGAE